MCRPWEPIGLRGAEDIEALGNYTENRDEWAYKSGKNPAW